MHKNPKISSSSPTQELAVTSPPSSSSCARRSPSSMTVPPFAAITDEITLYPTPWNRNGTLSLKELRDAISKPSLSDSRELARNTRSPPPDLTSTTPDLVFCHDSRHKCHLLSWRRRYWASHLLRGVGYGFGVDFRIFNKYLGWFWKKIKNNSQIKKKKF